MSSREETKETNIAVVVRVRPRNAKEIRDNSPSIVSTAGAKGRELVLKPSVHEPLTKTYTFDKVFGPECDQETVYKEVVSGMLDEVLLGYSATIFAYGQTGTGKTHTMLGDMSPIDGPQVGIIPRTLLNLFDTLERDTAEYSVRVSFLELYNEELRDLLSADDDFKKLRVFEDLSRKGSIVIHGLEEVLVKNTADVLAILHRGSLKKQIAATKLNENSSRSHCLFSITVHIKENTPEGEELLKVGKLNLVDLAGSENIGRSGAENKRAKEAGMINQSLLTLGRVINALVEHSPHIPYRESKLTRILQDSLGGRTKTCIIAAVSPARMNLEETLSTLEYAHRAKNIRNKPEVNQRMTKRALIRDYTNEIEKLKADLTATREKNGIFLSPENYETLLQENQGRLSRIEETTKLITFKEEQLAELDLQYKEAAENLILTSSQLKETLAELEDKRSALTEALHELKDVKQLLMEQEMLTEAHSTTEERLHRLAGGLVGTLKKSVADIAVLHSTLDRKDCVAAENQCYFEAVKQNIARQISGVQGIIDDFLDNTQLQTGQILEQVSRFGVSHNEDLMIMNAAISTGAEALVSSVTKATLSMEQDKAMLDRDCKTMAGQLKDTIQKTSQYGLGASALNKIHFEHLQSRLQLHKETIAANSDTLKSSVTRAVQEMVDCWQSHISRTVHQHSQKEASLLAEIEKLKQCNKELQKSLARESEITNKSEKSLISGVAELLSQFVSQKESRMGSIFSNVQTELNHRADGLRVILEDENHGQVRLTQDFEQLKTESIDALDKLCVKVEQDKETCSLQLEVLFSDQKSFEEETNASLINGVSSIEELMVSTKETLEKVYDGIHAVARNTLEGHADLSGSIVSMKDTSSALLQQSKECASAFVQKSKKEVEALSITREDFRTNNALAITKLIDKVHSERLSTDTFTGETPKRQEYAFPTKWNLTKSQEELIKEFRENQIASLLSCNKTDMGEVKHPESGLSPMSNVPLPDMEKENDAMDSDMESVKSASTKLPRPKTRSRSKKENVLMDIN